MTPLFVAAEIGHAVVSLSLSESRAVQHRKSGCTLLLEIGAHCEVRMRGNGWTPLFVAAWAGKAAAVKALLSQGADRNAATTAEHMGIPVASTPLSVALSQRHPEVAALLRGA